MLRVKESQVQILLVLYLLIAEDGFSAPLLFKNPACTCENIMLNTSNYQWGLVQNAQGRQLLKGPLIKSRVRRKETVGIIFKLSVNIIYTYMLYIHYMLYMSYVYILYGKYFVIY